MAASRSSQEAAVTVTDQGVFEAVISTATIDREKDIVEPAGMVKALSKWNRPIPLAWNHTSRLRTSSGPLTVSRPRLWTANEVEVGGQVDLESGRSAGVAVDEVRAGRVLVRLPVPKGGAKRAGWRQAHSRSSTCSRSPLPEHR